MIRNLNGFTIAQFRPIPEGIVILAFRIKGNETEWVTARMTHIDAKEWYWGHYFHDIEAATTDYLRR